MKEIRLSLSGMVGYSNPEDFFIINCLKKRYQVSIVENPDYLIYSQNSEDYLKHKCVRIFYTVENLVPDFNICDYGIGFQYLNFEDRYMRFPVYLNDGFKAYVGDNYGSDLHFARHKHENAEDTFRAKTEFCSFVYSNGKAAHCREKMFEALSKYKQVLSGGRYRNNVGGR